MYYLYFTEAKTHDGDDKEGNDPIGNRLYRYELIDNSLKIRSLLLDLPAGYHHNGGKILTGEDGDFYIAIGELDDKSTKTHKSNMALNFQEDLSPDGRGGILRINHDGDGVNGGIIGENAPLDKYFAYGIRNSFGLDIDPVTGNLWDTENGPNYGDEINLVEPGFNSGWRKVQGMWTVETGKSKVGGCQKNQVIWKTLVIKGNIVLLSLPGVRRLANCLKILNHRQTR